MSEQADIEFQCVKDSCENFVGFSLRQVERDHRILCGTCKNEYRMDDGLVDKLKTFAQLVHAVKNARDILGGTSVGVTVEGKTVKVPYRLLLTRMTTMLNLRIGEKALTFRFRVEPLKEDEIKSIH